INRVCEFLQVLNGAERVFVDCVAMVKIANDQRIDAGELREHLHQQAEALHGPKRQAGIVGGKDFAEAIPSEVRVARGKLWMTQDVVNGAFSFAADRDAHTRSFGKQGIHDEAIRSAWNVSDLEQAVTNSVGAPARDRSLGRSSGAHNTLAQRLRS